MRPPLVHCTTCEHVWHSPTLADGLRLLGHCPRCQGELVFTAAGNAAAEAVAKAPSAPPVVTALAPHLVLGSPRR